MSGALFSKPEIGDRNLLAFAPLFFVAIGWAVLFGPVYFEFAAVEWQRDENAHAPFLMAISIGAVIARLSSHRLMLTDRPIEIGLGLGVIIAGLALFVIGRATETTLFLSASQSFLAFGVVFSLAGMRGVKLLWFPLLLSLYLIVWPGWVYDFLTAPLKQFISTIVSEGLYAFGLPVAHSGAVITAGQYQLLVADACAGLNSLVALTAVGAVYLYVVKRRSKKVNAAVLVSLIPIAIVANLIRVALLVLLTYYFGYDVGQGFLHEGAGLLMFSIALAFVFVIDAVAARLWEGRG